MPTSDLEKRFTYHPPPDEETQTRYVRLRDAARRLAELYDDLVPDSREKSLALTKLEESNMWANAGVARNQLPAG